MFEPVNNWIKGFIGAGGGFSMLAGIERFDAKFWLGVVMVLGAIIKHAYDIKHKKEIHELEKEKIEKQIDNLDKK